MISRIRQALRTVATTIAARDLRFSLAYKNALESIRGRIEIKRFRSRWLRKGGTWPSQNVRTTGLLRDVFGPLSVRELDWLYEEAKRAVDYGDIVELGSDEGQCSCCIALACWGTRSFLHSIWGVDILEHGSIQARRFLVWHKNIIRKGLVPFVRPLTDIGRLSGVRVAMVLFGPNAALSDVNTVMRQMPERPRLIMGFSQTILKELSDREPKAYGQLAYLGW